jgi:hypothetical protein
MTLRLSVKQISMFGALQPSFPGGCPRKWALRYLDGLKTDYLPPQLSEGIRFHAVCAALVATGRMPEAGELQPGVVLTAADVLPESHLGRMARAALAHMPQHDGWVSEHVGEFPWVTSRGVECTIDLRPDVVSAPLGAPRLNYLVDFKSTGDRKWAMKSLLNDIQANVYSQGLMHHGATHVLARWIYVLKKDYSSWPVEAVFNREGVETWLHTNIDRTIELIHTAKESGLKALDLPGDEEACQSTGRFCDHWERCLGPVGARPAQVVSLDDVLRYKGVK